MVIFHSHVYQRKPCKCCMKFREPQDLRCVGSTTPKIRILSPLCLLCHVVHDLFHFQALQYSLSVVDPGGVLSQRDVAVNQNLPVVPRFSNQKQRLPHFSKPLTIWLANGDLSHLRIPLSQSSKSQLSSIRAIPWLYQLLISFTHGFVWKFRGK